MEEHLSKVQKSDVTLGQTTTAGVFANESRPVQQIILALLNHASIGRMQVLRISGKLSRLNPRVHCDLFMPMIEDADHPGLPTHPDLSAHVFRRHRVIGPLQFDMAVSMDATLSFFKAGKQATGQGQQAGSLDLIEDPAHLLPDGAVNACVGHRAFPVGQKKVLRPQTFKAAPFEGIVLGILDPGFDLALMPGHCGPVGKITVP
jgi:hypothetical protein